MYGLKVSKSQNESMKSLFLLKYDPDIVRISTLYFAKLQGRNFYKFILKFIDLLQIPFCKRVLEYEF